MESEVITDGLSKKPRAVPSWRDTRAGALLSEFWVLFLSLLYFLLVSLIVPDLTTTTNLFNIFSNLLPLLIVAVGQTFVLIGGGIDLSITSIIALTSVVGGMVMSADQGWLGGSPFAAVAGCAAMLALGAFVGWCNGLAITKLRMPPFIVTLTMMMFLSGLAIWMTRSRNIYNLPPAFIEIGKGSLFRAVPYALLISLFVVAAAHLLLSRTVFGARLYATGLSARTSLVSGVPVSRIVTQTYIISGLCAALASIFLTGRLETSSPVLGQKILLDVIGAVVIGGTSLFGGKGKVLWTCCGMLFMTIIDNSLNLLGLSYFVVMIVKGAVILAAALIDAMRVRFFTVK